jgi:hypothetical protein
MIKSVANGSAFLRFSDFAIVIPLTLIPPAIAIAVIHYHWSLGNYAYYPPEHVTRAVLITPVYETFVYFVPIIGIMHLMRFNFWVIVTLFTAYFTSMHITMWVLPVALCLTMIFLIFLRKGSLGHAILYTWLSHMLYNLYLPLLDPGFYSQGCPL